MMTSLTSYFEFKSQSNANSGTGLRHLNQEKDIVLNRTNRRNGFIIATTKKIKKNMMTMT